MRGSGLMSRKPDKGKNAAKPEEAGGLVPRLRFPEFREAGEWESAPMEEMYAFKATNSLSRDKLNYEGGFVKNVHYGDIHTRFPALFNVREEYVPYVNVSEPIDNLSPDSYCVEGDMIIADASEDLEDIGKSIEIVRLHNERVLSGMHTILARQRECRLVVGFGGHLFRSNSIREQIKKEAQGTKVLGISVRRISKINIFYPQNRDEQQKIADCLTSLDDRIRLETERLNALKDHKKGLMQQMFPAGGETVPRLRFAEFREAGEWDVKMLGDCLDYQQPTDYIVSDTNYDDSYPTPVLTAGKTFVLGYTNEKHGIFSKHLPVIIFDDFTTASKFVDFPFKVKSSAMKILQAKNGLSVKFMYEIMQTISYEVGAHERHWISKFAPMSILVPQPEEQQKIANCLSSLDDRIRLETERLNALKDHKKGLMQQLFPDVHDIAV